MSFYTISLLLGVLTNQASAGCGMSSLRGEDPCPPTTPAGPPVQPWLNKCPKGMPKQWACLDPKIEFPTVECIVADLKACGTLDNSRVLLYSYGATTVEVREKVRDTLGDPRPVMFNDALPTEWDKAIFNEPRFGLTQGKIADPDVNKRNEAFVNRFSSALTVAAKGQVIMVTKSRDSKYGGSGAYSKPNPADAKPNVWRNFEFPLAQRNPDVTQVVSYALDEDPLRPVVDFEPGKGHEMLPMPTFPDPPLKKVKTAPGPMGPLGGPPKKPDNGEGSSKKPVGGGGRRPIGKRGQEFRS